MENGLIPKHVNTIVAMPKDFHTTLLFTISAAMLCFAPIMRSGRMYPALWFLEILGVLLLVLAFWKPIEKQRIPLLAWLMMIVSILIPLIYLIPIPFELWKTLPGRSLYVDSINLLTSLGGSFDYLALSLIPYRTLSSLLGMLPILGIFLATLLLPRQQLTTLTYLFLGIAAFQAALGLIQYSGAAEWAFWWNIKEGRLATGTYPNYDHYAALMEITIPIAIALLAYNIHNPHHTEKDSAFILNRALIFFTLTVLLVLASIFSRSRTGILLSGVGILIASITFSRHAGGKQSAGLMTVLMGVSIGVASSIGLVPVIQRFAIDPEEDIRWEIYATAMQGVKSFFPLGSGPQTFQPVFFAFQPPELQTFVNHVHNDYLEWLFETGLVGIPLLVLGILLYGYGWVKLRKHRWDRFHFIQTASGISLLLLALHGLLDFNFHTPANMIFFAFLTGIFLHSSTHRTTTSADAHH